MAPRDRQDVFSNPFPTLIIYSMIRVFDPSKIFIKAPAERPPATGAEVDVYGGPPAPEPHRSTSTAHPEPRASSSEHRR